MVLPGPWQVRDGADAYHRVFSTEVQLPADWPLGSPAWLELQGASQILRVQVNGQPVGERFCSPYRFEVGKQLRAGGNQIEIERIGRYSSPVEIANMGKLSFTDDKNAVSPCQRATLTSHRLTVIQGAFRDETPSGDNLVPLLVLLSAAVGATSDELAKGFQTPPRPGRGSGGSG